MYTAGIAPAHSTTKTWQTEINTQNSKLKNNTSDK